MKLAINYSPEAEQLIKSGTIYIDFFKTPEWEWLVTRAQATRPVAVHFTLTAGNGKLDQVNWNLVDRLCNSTGTPHINLHIEVKTSDLPAIRLASKSLSVRDQVFERVLFDVRQVIRRYGVEHVIVENLYLFYGLAGDSFRDCIEPDFITSVVNETGCGLLLDIAHASIAADQIGMEPDEYFSRLPVHQLKELHFAGIHRRHGEVRDHRSILKRDWQRLDWILTRIRTGAWHRPFFMAEAIQTLSEARSPGYMPGSRS
jgi:uncharacterized protein